MFSSSLFCLLTCAVIVRSNPYHGITIRKRHGAAPTVDLGYATYQGVRLETGVDQYLGMRYAQAPLGDLRFRGPQDPVSESGVQDASGFGPICVGASQEASANRTEDCLFVNVFTPSNATADSQLPVWLYIQGGGWTTDANANYNGTEVVRQSGYNIILVNFNYRVGALGFLASEKVGADGDLNAGLLDQRKVLYWVQDNIAKFGGDPSHVVIHGASAGAGSVAHHLTAYDGEDKGLFAGAVPESTFWPTQRTVGEMEFQFDRFVNDTGCSDADDALSCLRCVDLDTIQAANIDLPFPGAGDDSAPLWYWLPVVTGPATLVPCTLYDSFEAGKFVKVPLLVGDDTDEGTDFAVNASSQAEVATSFKNNYPGLSEDQLEDINEAYPLMSPLPEHAAYFPSAAAAYGEATFTCPGNTMAESMASHLACDKVWNYRYNVIDPENIAAGIGVPHTFETSAIFGPGYAGSAAESYTTTNAAIVPVVMMYWISFVRSLDPNQYRAQHSPSWEPWGDFGNGRGYRLKIQTNDTAIEEVPQDQADRCTFWKELRKAMEV